MSTKPLMSLTAAAMMAASTATLAMDEGDVYAGGGYHAGDITTEDGTNSEPSMLMARVGRYIVQDNFALEARFGTGLESDGLGPESSVDIDRIYGGYGVFHLPVAERTSLYALAGFSSIEIDVTESDGSSARIDETDLSYGIGADVALTKKLYGYAEFVRYHDEDRFDLEGLSAGVLYQF
jgi:opacity protein-like surface antigen